MRRIGPPSPWNSLEVAKLVVSCLTPLAILGVGVWLQAMKDELIKANARTAEKRLAVYDQVGRTMNDLYCYRERVGNWKMFSPPEILEKKRSLDSTMFTYRPVFSVQLFNRYEAFVYQVFERRTDEFADPRIRCTATKYEKAAVMNGSPWKPEWDKLFVEEDLPEDSVHETYYQFLSSLAQEFGLHR